VLLFGGSLAMLVGCATQAPAPVVGEEWVGPVPDGYHLIRRGDTLSGLAARLGVSLETLARWNGIESPDQIYAGRLLRIVPPDGSPPPRPARTATAPTAPGRAAAVVQPTHPATSGHVAPSPAATRKVTQAAPATSRRSGAPPASTVTSPAPPSGIVWAWPLGGKVVQRFDGADRTRQGLRIRGRSGEPVMAAAAGRVVYSGNGLQGYGNLIIVKHNEKYLSAYGFNRALLVKEGERVERGQAVAEVGQASEGGPYLLHFEIRKDGSAIDPLLYLPPRE
jgi:lipoprotein NlpD